jgi:hypothetical protein
VKTVIAVVVGGWMLGTLLLWISLEIYHLLTRTSKRQAAAAELPAARLALEDAKRARGEAKSAAKDFKRTKGDQLDRRYKDAGAAQDSVDISSFDVEEKRDRVRALERAGAGPWSARAAALGMVLGFVALSRLIVPASCLKEGTIELGVAFLIGEVAFTLSFFAWAQRR